MPATPHGRYSPAHHQPIFRARPDLAPRKKAWTVDKSADKPLVTPLCVFAASKQSFRCVVRRLELQPLQIIFDALPLAEAGWDITTTKVIPDGSFEHWPVWLVKRG